MRIPAHLRTSFIKEAIKNGMRVLTYDIETSHMIVRTFYIGPKVNIMHKQVKVPNKVITIQYKWAHEKQARYLVWDRVSDKFDDARNFDDANMIEEFATNILSKADIVITQNGDKFDYVVLNERAKALQLPIFNVLPSLDILKLSRKSFKAASHKLDYRSEQQGLGGKRVMIDQDWVDIEENGVPAEKEMVPYGLKDTIDTEKLFWRELPYYKDIPVAVEKVIYNYLKLDNKPKEKVVSYYCSNCRQKRHLATDIKNGKCNTCGLKKHVKRKS